MQMTTRTFTLTDADGRPHRYEVDLHRATEGQAIHWQLVGLLAGPLSGLLAMVAPLLDLAGGRKLSEVLDDPAVLSAASSALRGADLTSIGREVQRVLSMSVTPALADQIRRQTRRDGKDLADPVVFDEAYVGNYWEADCALWEVVLANRFLPRLDIQLAAPKAKTPTGGSSAPSSAPPPPE